MNNRGSSILQVLMVIAVTALVGGGVVQMTQLAGSERSRISERKKIDAFTDYLGMLLMDPAACDQFFMLGNIPANLPQDREVNNIGVRIAMPSASSSTQNPSSATPGGVSSSSFAIVGQGANGVLALRDRFGANLNALNITYKSLGGDRGQIVVKAQPTRGPAISRVAGQMSIIPGNPARCAGGAAGPQLTCTRMGGILETQTDGSSRCVIAPRDMAPCDPTEYIANINPPTEPGADPVVVCQSAEFVCPPGRYFVGILNGAPECQPVQAVAATPTPAAPIIPSIPTPTPVANVCPRDCNLCVAFGNFKVGPFPGFCDMVPIRTEFAMGAQWRAVRGSAVSSSGMSFCNRAQPCDCVGTVGIGGMTAAGNSGMCATINGVTQR